MKFKFIVASLAIFSVMFFGGGGSVLAREPEAKSANLTESSESAKLDGILKTIVDPGSLEVGDSLVSPSSPLYFLKALREKIELYLSANDQIKAQRELEFAVRRLREIKTLIEEGRQDLIEVTLQKYRNHLDAVRKIGGGTKDFRVDLASSTARHMYVFQSLYYNTSNQMAQRAIRTSVERVLEYNWELLSSDLEKKEEKRLVENIGLRQIAGCQFLNQEARNTTISQSEREILKEYVQGCKEKAETYFKDQINQIDIGN